MMRRWHPQFRDESGELRPIEDFSHLRKSENPLRHPERLQLIDPQARTLRPADHVARDTRATIVESGGMPGLHFLPPPRRRDWIAAGFWVGYLLFGSVAVVAMLWAFLA